MEKAGGNHFAPQNPFIDLFQPAHEIHTSFLAASSLSTLQQNGAVVGA
jgi:hypothetical protein